MKIIVLLISFYMLALNAFPCNDAVTLDDNPKTEIVTAVDMDHGHSHRDLCPPFCTCHCCHVHTIAFGSRDFEPMVPEISSEVFLHIESRVEEPIFPLLQPPRA